MVVATPVLSVKGLNSSYGVVPALRDICLEVQPREIVAVVGANGAGRTTLMKVLIGLHPATSGSVVYNGLDVTTAPTTQRVASGMALVPEGRKVFPRLTVRENLLLGAYVINERHLRDVTLESVLALFPILSSRLTQLAGTLSGGEQQMLAIGRGMMSRPKLLLLDEPSMGVAPKIVDEIFATLVALQKNGLSIVLVEQNADRALEIATRASVLELGAVIREGISSSLRNDPVIQEAYLGGA